MARRIRWQIVVASLSALLVMGLMSRLALTSTSVASPLAGGAYVEAVAGAPVQVIPLLNDPLTDPVGRDLGALLFDGLTRIGSDGLPEPALAESWQIDPGGTVYTFRLRRDVTWHDGRPFGADDVVFTLRAIQDSRFNGNPALVTLWRDVLVDRIDEHTVRCTLKAPYAPFPSVARVPILPAHLLRGLPVDQWAAADFARRPVGTGPYRLLELSEQRARLERNPDYFAGAPFLEQVELRFFAAPEAALSALTRGEVQAMGSSTADELALVNLPRNLRRFALPQDEYAVLTFNLRRAPLDNLALRQALARGLDKAALLDDAGIFDAEPLATPIMNGWWAFDPTARWYAYDPLLAQLALSELGYDTDAAGMLTREGQPLTLPLITDGEPRRLAAARAVARQWQALGVRVEVEELDSATLRQRLRDRDFVLALHAWTRLGADPDVFELWHSSQAENGLNYAGLRDAAIDDLLIGARTESELAVRNDDYSAFQRRWIDLVPSIVLYQKRYTFAVDERLNGMGFAPNEGPGLGLLVGREDRYRNITRWFVNSSREIRGNLR